VRATVNFKVPLNIESRMKVARACRHRGVTHEWDDDRLRIRGRRSDVKSLQAALEKAIRAQ